MVLLLLIEDIQTVALQEIDRKLSSEEIESIKELIAEKIPWYDAISDAITEKLMFNEGTNINCQSLSK